MVKQIMAYFLYSLEERQCDPRPFREAVKATRLATRKP